MTDLSKLTSDNKFYLFFFVYDLIVALLVIKTVRRLRRALHEIWNLAHAPASGNAKNCTLKEKLSERQGDLGSVYEREALRENTVDASSNAQLHMLAMTEGRIVLRILF